jgi:hypothetical protein
MNFAAALLPDLITGLQKYPIPLNPSAGGNGRWTTFKAATCQVDAIRQQDSTRLYLQLPPIGREVYFNTSGRSDISECHKLPLLAPFPLTLASNQSGASGILIFRDVKKLKNRPLEDDPNGQDNRPLVADYAPDRIVFHLQKKVGETKLKEFGLVSPCSVCVFSVSNTEETVSCSSSVSHASGENWLFCLRL